MAVNTITITGLAVNVMRSAVPGEAVLLVQGDDGKNYALTLAVQIKTQARRELKWKQGMERKRVRVSYFVASSDTKIATAYNLILRSNPDARSTEQPAV